VSSEISKSPNTLNIYMEWMDGLTTLVGPGYIDIINTQAANKYTSTLTRT